MTKHIEDWTLGLFKIIFAMYLLVTAIVLINLLIAMMSDTYQRIQQDSDTEWKFGLAKLIRNMHRTNASPAPINLITTWTVYIINKCKSKLFANRDKVLINNVLNLSPERMKKKDKYKRMKQYTKDKDSLASRKRKGKFSPFPR